MWKSHVPPHLSQKNVLRRDMGELQPHFSAVEIGLGEVGDARIVFNEGKLCTQIQCNYTK
jgi:hypothetical protein